MRHQVNTRAETVQRRAQLVQLGAHSRIVIVTCHRELVRSRAESLPPDAWTEPGQTLILSALVLRPRSAHWS